MTDNRPELDPHQWSIAGGLTAVAIVRAVAEGDYVHAEELWQTERIHDGQGQHVVTALAIIATNALTNLAAFDQPPTTLNKLLDRLNDHYAAEIRAQFNYHKETK